MALQSPSQNETQSALQSPHRAPIMYGLQQFSSLALRSWLAAGSLGEAAVLGQALPSLAHALQALQTRGVKKQANEVGRGRHPQRRRRRRRRRLPPAQLPSPRVATLVRPPSPLQLRVGNVIEHNGKLLQVVSLQNRAMGVRGVPRRSLMHCRP